MNVVSRLRLIPEIALCVLVFSHSIPADAQEQKKVPRIGWLSSGSSSSTSSTLEAFRKGMIALGYVERKNIETIY